MNWIHEHEDWPSLIWSAEALSKKLAEIRHRQGRLLGRMESLGFDSQKEANLETITMDVVKSSAIEGEILNTEEVRSSIARRLGIEIAGMVRAGRDVEGVVEMMLDATQNFSDPLIKDRIFGWHAALFPTGRSGMHKITVGAWRPESAGVMQVISGPIGHEKVHFEVPSAERLSLEMKKFLSWYEKSQEIDPVLKAGIAHFWFVTVHPFEDGNGRIARAISDLSLARADKCKNRFYSMSSQIEKERKAYYEHLERQQRGSLDITEWLDWFLDCLGRALNNAEETLGIVLFKACFWKEANKTSINVRQRLILNRMLDNFKGFMSTSKYAKITKCSQDTALRDIRDLTNKGLLIQNTGGGRSTSYRLPTKEDLVFN